MDVMVVMESYYFMSVYSFNIDDNVSSKVKCCMNKTLLNVLPIYLISGVLCLTTNISLSLDVKSIACCPLSQALFRRHE